MPGRHADGRYDLSLFSYLRTGWRGTRDARVHSHLCEASRSRSGAIVFIPCCRICLLGYRCVWYNSVVVQAQRDEVRVEGRKRGLPVAIALDSWLGILLEHVLLLTRYGQRLKGQKMKSGLYIYYLQAALLLENSARCADASDGMFVSSSLFIFRRLSPCLRLA
jgi:hypothetical protein